METVETNDPGLCGYSKQDLGEKRSSNRISSPPHSTSTTLLPSPPAIDPLLQRFIICNVVSKNKDREKVCLSERNRVKTFLTAMKFNEDEVHQRCILYENPGDIFAADLYVHQDFVMEPIPSPIQLIPLILMKLRFKQLLKAMRYLRSYL